MLLPRICYFLLIFIFATTCHTSLAAQRIDRAQSRLEDHRLEHWPPTRVYSRTSLGRALQDIFQKHYQYCGFMAADERRDYLPADISLFLGKRDLRTKIETADFSGEGLLSYVFREDETITPLNAVRFRPEFRLELPGSSLPFELSPDEAFDTFVLTENCSGYLKAALDAGIEPPYAAFRAALETDDRKESTVLAVAGTFRSPLASVLRANDYRTTALMLRLWEFYQQHPEYIGRAHYLQSFAGVMIKHTASAEESRQIENELGMNFNGPFGIKANANLENTRKRRTSFSGTDWETIVYTDFDEQYQRERWYARLPDPAEISDYFARLHPVFESHTDYPLLTEGVEHRHYIRIEGIPPALARNGWILENVASGVYGQAPRLEAQPYEENGRFGCRFTIVGDPAPTLFSGPLLSRPGKQQLTYRIRSRQSLGQHTLAFTVQEQLPTSAHPVVQLGDGQFDLSIKEDRRFALQWKVPLEVTDAENPVDFMKVPFFTGVQLQGNETSNLPKVQIREVMADVRRNEYALILETVETWPLSRINDQELERYNLSCQVHLPAQRSENRMQRPLKGVISLPKINPPEPVVIPDTLKTVPVIFPVPMSGN